MEAFDLQEHSHRRYNPLTGEWIQVSPHRAKRPWQGQQEEPALQVRESFDPSCYLCPGNTRASGDTNPDYPSVYVFTNDFSALETSIPDGHFQPHPLIQAKSEKGLCRVICFSPDHSLTLAQMSLEAIVKVVETWQKEYIDLGNRPEINYVQIFENKGAIMGCSNPHPHGQIWATETLPYLPAKEDERQETYYQAHHKSLLADYLDFELEAEERLICVNKYFVALVPFWAVWPYEALVMPRRHVQDIGQLTPEEVEAYAAILKELCRKYDALFSCSFPYSAGIHQAPTNNLNNAHWHMHMHFYPPLLRSATVRKFMVGFEMLANAQRDLSAEFCAGQLREL